MIELQVQTDYRCKPIKGVFMEEYMLSDSELLIMKIIWKSNQSLSLQEIMERLNKEWSPKTVSVFLGRIVKKNLLVSQRKGKQFYYTPTTTEEEYMKKEVTKCVDSLSDGQADVFLAALVGARGLTDKEKEKIRGLLDELE